MSVEARGRQPDSVSHPAEGMPKSIKELSQMALSVMRFAGAPCSRQLLPPQPAQEIPRFS